MKNLFYYHENSRTEPWKPVMDAVYISPDEGFIAIADGIARDYCRKSCKYPHEIYGQDVAELFVTKAHELYKTGRFNLGKGEISELLHEVNRSIRGFNESVGFNYDEIKEKYWVGECVGGVAIVEGDKLYYGVAEDVYLNVLRGNDMEDMIKMKHQIMKSYEHGKRLAELDESKSFEKIWCAELRNNPEAKDENGDPTGWCSFTGEAAAGELWQTGEVDLQEGDIIMAVTNGAVPLFKEHPFTSEFDELLFEKANSMGVKSQEEVSNMIVKMMNGGVQGLGREKTIVKLVVE